MTSRDPSQSPRSRERDRGYRRALAWGLAASAALHAAVLFLAPGAVIPGDGAPSGEPGPEPLPRGIQAVDVRAAEPAASPERVDVRMDVPTPSRATPVLAQMDPVTVEDPTPRWGSGGDPGGASGGQAGAGGGSGAGDGGGGGGLSPPVPRSLLPDWSPPDEVRGHRVTVRVQVDPRGRPTGRVELVPPTPSDDFNRRLKERMVRLEFLPARRDGRPVTAWAEITFTF